MGLIATPQDVVEVLLGGKSRSFTPNLSLIRPDICPVFGATLPKLVIFKMLGIRALLCVIRELELP